MHKYLRAIGFSKYNKKRELRPLLDLVIQSSTASSLMTEGDEVYGHISRAFGDRFGLRLYVRRIEYLATEDKDDSSIRDEGTVIRRTEAFIYLGSRTAADGEIEHEVTARINAAWMK